MVSRDRALAAAEVKHLVLFHHDPERMDDELDVIQEENPSVAAATSSGRLVYRRF